MGLALRGRELSTREVTERDFNLARDLNLPVSIHAGMASYASRYRTVETLDELGLLGPDVNYAHADLFTNDDYRLVAESGESIAAGRPARCPSNSFRARRATCAFAASTSRNIRQR